MMRVTCEETLIYSHERSKRQKGEKRKIHANEEQQRHTTISYASKKPLREEQKSKEYLSEALPAVLALVRLLAGVRSDVAIQVRGVAEPLVAVLAAVRLVTGQNLDVRAHTN